MYNDVRQSIRKLLGTPGFTCLAALVLAAGIGANASIFSILNRLLLKPLPVADPDRVVRLYADWIGSWPDYLYHRDHQNVFDGLAAYNLFSIADETGRLQGQFVSGNLFPVLGLRMAFGRPILPGDDQVPGGSPVVVLSYSFWQRRFQSDPGVLGRTLMINGQPFSIVGVAGRGVAGPEPKAAPDFWAPATMCVQVLQTDPESARRMLEAPGTKNFNIIGRLKPGVSPVQAEAVMTALMRRFEASYNNPVADLRNERVRLLPVRGADLRPEGRVRVLGVLEFALAAVGLVLLIACANIASLLLARATEQRKEIAIRAALGAGRARLARQFLVESAVLALLGCGGGLLFAAWMLPVLSRVLVPVLAELAYQRGPVDVGLDLRVCLFTAAVSLATGLLAGLSPAIQGSRTDLAAALKSGQGPAYRWRVFSLRNVFVMAQVAASVVLLAGAGLFVRSLQSLLAIDMGFRAADVLLVAVNAGRKLDATHGRQLFGQLEQRVSALPGIRSAALAALVPLANRRMMRDVIIDGKESNIDCNSVGARYFETMGIPILRGRGLEERDRPVAVVSETLARRYWPGEEAIGKSINVNGLRIFEVVGIAKDARYRSLTEGEPRPRFFIPYQHDPIYARQMTLHVRTQGRPSQLAPAVLREIDALQKSVLSVEARSMEDQIGDYLWRQQIGAKLLGLLGGVGLLLAAGGIYGVVAYAVARRTHEIGIRMALGASGQRVLGQVVAQAMSVVMVGMAAGVLLALMAARLTAGLLYGVRPMDPAAFGAATALLGGAALAACIVPARRATCVDPLVALRYE